MLAYARRLGIEKQLDLRRVLAFLLPKFTDILGCRSPILAEPGGTRLAHREIRQKRQRSLAGSTSLPHLLSPFISIWIMHS